jgi:hypothetical protein
VGEVCGPCVAVAGPGVHAGDVDGARGRTTPLRTLRTLKARRRAVRARHGAKTVWGLLTRTAATILAHTRLRLAGT